MPPSLGLSTALLAATLITTASAGAATSLHRVDLTFRSRVAHRHSGQDYKTVELKECPRARASKHFATCDQPCTTVNTEPVSLAYVDTTASGESTVETVQAVLAAAWAGFPDKVDLWLRTGCHGARELKYLVQSVELFWPRGIGSIVLVLDDNDRPIAHHMVPNASRHDWLVRYEHVPCMPARVFNQVSYMMADHYSTADVIVTIDSDCVLHSPVTPRLLFRDGKIRLPYSRAFQAGMWESLVEFFIGPGTFKFHTMVSQPVTFHRSTLAAFREWYKAAHNGTCYLDDVARALDEVDPGLMGAFCWMCQLGGFLSTTGITADLYDFVDLDAPTPHPYQRLSVHTTYELAPGADFYATSELAVEQGLCLALGAAVLPQCAGVDTGYVRERMFKYELYNWRADAAAKNATVEAYVGEIRQLLQDAAGRWRPGRRRSLERGRPS